MQGSLSGCLVQLWRRTDQDGWQGEQLSSGLEEQTGKRAILWREQVLQSRGVVSRVNPLSRVSCEAPRRQEWLGNTEASMVAGGQQWTDRSVKLRLLRPSTRIPPPHHHHHHHHQVQPATMAFERPSWREMVCTLVPGCRASRQGSATWRNRPAV